MKIGVLIPTRGDRQKFLDHALYLIAVQTYQPHFIEVVDEQPISQEKDITYRYKVGCKRLIEKGADIIFFWEDDDWYSSLYINTMLLYWKHFGEPDIFGINNTIYYHLRLRRWFLQLHPGRASAFSTLVTKNILQYPFPQDTDPFLDLHLWKTIPGKAFEYQHTLNIGIKHGIGLCGGSGHSKHSWYKNDDRNWKWLSSIVDRKSLDFYKSL